MNDEANTSSAKLSKSAILSILFWACVFLLALCIFIFARVHAVRINGNQLYTKEQLLLDCGITLGERLYGMDRDEIEAQILQKFPMIESVSVDRGGFFSVVIDVKERQSAYYIVHTDGTYLYLSDNFYVLGKSEISPAQKGLSLLQLETPDIYTATYGTQIEFVTSPHYGETLQGLAYNEKMIAFLNELRNAPFYASLTSASLREPNQLSVYIDEMQLYFGARDNIAAKCTAISALLAENSAVLSTVRKINAADPNKATVLKKRTPVYYTKTAQGDYLYLSDNFYVLEKSEISPAQKGLSLLCLTTPEIITATYGRQIEFDTSAYGETHRGSAYNASMITFLTALKSASFYTRLTSADLTEPFMLRVFIGNTEIYLKDQSLLVEKFAAVASVLEQHAAQLSQIKKINASDPQRVTPVFVES